MKEAIVNEEEAEMKSKEGEDLTELDTDESLFQLQKQLQATTKNLLEKAKKKKQANQESISIFTITSYILVIYHVPFPNRKFKKKESLSKCDRNLIESVKEGNRD